MQHFSRFLISFAYKLHSSNSYRKNRQFFYNILENDNYKYKKYVDFFMILLILISVFVLIREVKHHINDTPLFFNNYVISFLFLTEYLLRLWVNTNVVKIIIEQDEKDTILMRKFHLKRVLKKIFTQKLTYILQPKSIVDLLAILPFFHELRLLRLFILFRVFKLFRYTKSFRNLLKVLASKKFEFLTLFMFASIIIFVSSVLIYVIEGNNPESNINTFFDAIYWSIVTLSTVGFGDITPITTEGRFVAMMIIISGVAVLSFSTSLIVSAFNERLDEFRDAKVIEKIAKLRSFYLICGYESIAKEVIQKLHVNRKYIIVIDKDEQKIEQAKRDGLKALRLNPGSITSYTKLHIDFNKQVSAVLCLHYNDIENVYTALTVRSINKDVAIYSLLENDTNRKKLLFAGVNELIYPQELVAMITKELVGQPVAFEAIHTLRSSLSPINLEEILITKKVIENYNYISDINNKKYRVVILGIYKQSDAMFWFNPIDSTLLEVGDLLLAIGYNSFIDEFEKHLHKKGEE